MNVELHFKIIRVAQELKDAGVPFILALPMPDSTEGATRCVSNLDEMAPSPLRTMFLDHIQETLDQLKRCSP